MSQGLSFAGWAHMTPRERMLHALAGNGAATFGLEVGSPRGQLGVIPMRGLGLLAVRAPRIMDAMDAGYTIPMSTGPAPIDLTTPNPVTSPSAPSAMALPTRSDLINMGLPREAPTTSYSNEPEDYDYSEVDPGREGGGDPNQPMYADPAQESAQNAWAGGEDDGKGWSPPVSTIEQARRTKLKTTATAAQAAAQAAQQGITKYAPWILGGLAVAGLAFYMGKRK